MKNVIAALALVAFSGLALAQAPAAPAPTNEAKPAGDTAGANTGAETTKTEKTEKTSKSSKKHKKHADQKAM